MKKLCNALIFGLLFLWQLPQNLVALVWLAVSRPVKKIAYRPYSVAFAARMPKGASGVSLGSFAIVSPAHAGDQRVVRHELDGHTVDSTTGSAKAAHTTFSTPNAGPTATQD